MKALVTGGTGFVGSHVVRQLIEQGHEVRVLHRKTSRLTLLEDLPYESIIGDVLDTDVLQAACAGCDWVFHVAAVSDYWRADRDYLFRVNVEGTRRVLQAAAESGVKRVVFTSSAAAVGLNQDGTASDESVAFNLSPEQFPYAYSKALAERVVHEAIRNGLDVVIVNPVIVMGPGDLNLISGSFVIQVKKLGVLVPISSGGASFVDVRDVGRWQVEAAEQGQTGERYILSTAQYSLREWYTLIAAVVDSPAPIFGVPDTLVPAVATFTDLARRFGLNLPVDADQVRLSTRQVYFDGSKAWEAFSPPAIDMETSLRDTYNWYREQGMV